MAADSPELTSLKELAHSYGIATDYQDWRGRHVEVPTETVTDVLAAMGVDASDPRRALTERSLERWRRMLPGCVVVSQGATGDTFWVHVSHGADVEVWLELENGGRHDQIRQLDRPVDPRHVDGRLVGEATFAVPTDLPLGYHTLHARSEGHEATSTLVVTPARLELPDRLRDRHAWGFAAQLYSVRSRRSWGVGDLVDLTDLTVWSAGLGADFLLVNPLHAGEPTAPLEPSPYLPSSRRFFNPLYLRVERIPEYADLGAQERRTVDRLAAEVHADLDDADVIDRDTSWRAKRAALELVHGVARSAGRELDLQAFRCRQGEALRDYATWNVIAREHGTDFRAWPQALRDVSSPEVAAYRDRHQGDLDFETWLQWVLDEQLQGVQGKAVQAGMALGTMHDLAVGVSAGGADAWRLRSSYAIGIQVGAPPDPFNQLGQDWGQPPWRPETLHEQAYAPFRDLIGAVLRHAGGVRIDHVIGMFRLWWVPRGRSAADGTYVRYDHEALIGVLALEAHRAGAVVVGEDLGVVEPSARDYLASRGILGTSILWFERDQAGQPLPAERWRELCLASVTTHDLPPTAGYLDGEHVALRDRLGLLTRPVEEERAADEAERASWLAEVASRGLLPDGADSERTVRALHEYLALTPSRLRCVALTDAVGDRRTQNQPGTTDEYPNWRVPLSGPDGTPMLLEDVLASARAGQVGRILSD